MGGKVSKNLQMEGATYLWQVESITDVLTSNSKFSSPFEVFEDSYRLELNNDLEIKLHQTKESDVLKKFHCVSSILDLQGIQHYSQKKEVEIGKGANNVVLLTIPRSFLVQESVVVSMNSFYVSLKISIVDSSKSSAFEVNSSIETLSSDMRKLYSSQADSDVEIRTNTDEYFKAHRFILSARSPVFEAMFRHNTTERAKGVISIPDVETPILASLFLYIYTGNVYGLDSNTATQLYHVADKYDLQDLKDTCLEFLLTNLTMINIFDAVILAEMGNIPSLKKEVHAFIAKNKAEVMQSEKWESLTDQHPDMVNSILTALLIST